MEVNKKPVLLEFRTEELLHDICTIAHNEGEARSAEDEAQGVENDGHLTSIVQSPDDDSNIDRVARVLNMAHGECVEMLYAYTKEGIGKAEFGSNELKEKMVYAIELMVPDTMSRTSVNLLKEYVNEYMVARVLTDWFSMNYPKAAVRWRETVDDMKDKIKSCTVNRMRRVRRTLRPF